MILSKHTIRTIISRRCACNPDRPKASFIRITNPVSTHRIPAKVTVSTGRKEHARLSKANLPDTHQPISRLSGATALQAAFNIWIKDITANSGNPEMTLRSGSQARLDQCRYFAHVSPACKLRLEQSDHLAHFL